MAEPRNVDQRIEERRIVFFSPPPPSIIHPAVTRGLRQKSIFLCLPFDCSASFWKKKRRKERQTGETNIPPLLITSSPRLSLSHSGWCDGGRAGKTRRSSDSSSVLVRRRTRFGVKSHM